MPIYEYICKDCGHRFDVLVSMKDSENIPVCENCTNQNVSRVLSLISPKSCCQSTSGYSNSCSGCSGGHCSSCR